MKRSGLAAIDGGASEIRLFFFNFNGLGGFHQVSIHLGCADDSTI